MTRCSACDQPLRGTPFCPACGQPTRALTPGPRPVAQATPPPASEGAPELGDSTVIEAKTAATPPAIPSELTIPPRPPARPESLPPPEAPRKGGGGGTWILVTGMLALAFVLLGCCLLWAGGADQTLERQVDPSPTSVVVRPYRGDRPASEPAPKREPAPK